MRHSSFREHWRYGDEILGDVIGTMTFSDLTKAVQWLEGRGYMLTEQDNWLPPANIAEPSATDQAAAEYLAAYSDYGHIIKLRPCPFCGGKPDPHGPLGVECVDCGAIAVDVGKWQHRVGP